MDIKSLMSGIAVVIDDAFKVESPEGHDDRIFQIVEKIEKRWEIPFYKTYEIPSDSVSRGLLQSASFILLDWKLWPDGAQELEKESVNNNIKFLEKAKEYFVPVFIFTNENPLDVATHLHNSSLYSEEQPERNFIFIKQKEELIKEDIFDSIRKWVRRNASVYTLKTWEREFYESKRMLFSSMYAKSPDWPKVFWKSYKDDGVDPSSSVTTLINDNLSGRFKTDIFEKQILGSGLSDVPMEEIKSLVQEASFITKDALADDEIRSGDLFKMPRKKYLINIRPDCDCVPRGNVKKANDVDLYCIEGKGISKKEVSQIYEDGHFNERVWESISFNLYGGETIRFDFRKLEKKKFSEIKDNRVGRLIHPYITRIQQRYAFYLQRQGLPRIPKEAVCEEI